MIRSISFNLTGNPSLLASQAELMDEILPELEVCKPWRHARRFREDALNVSFFLPRKAEVLLHHTASDRNSLLRRAADGSFLARQFQTLLLPGQWMRQRILAHEGLGFREENLIAVGSPRIDLLRRLQAAQPAREGAERKRVLWLPSPPASVPDGNGGRMPDPISSQAALNGAADWLSSICDLVQLPDLHTPAFDPRSATRALLDCDLVVTDCAPVYLDAWVLGKPVVFTSWLTGPHVISRFPGSAEAHVHQHRIGLHADSPDDLGAKILAADGIGPDVVAFLSGYFENLDGESAAQRFAWTVARIRDPQWAPPGASVAPIPDRTTAANDALAAERIAEQLCVALNGASSGEALDRAVAELASGDRPVATGRLVARELTRRGRRDIARQMLTGLCAAHPSRNLFLEAVATVTCAQDLEDLSSALIPVQNELSRAIGKFSFDLGRLAAMLRGGDTAQAVPLASAWAAAMVSGKPPATVTTGQGKTPVLPFWFLPRRADPVEDIAGTDQPVVEALATVLDHVARDGLEIFPVGATLAQLHDPAEDCSLRVLEFGILATSDITATLQALDRTGYLELGLVEGGDQPHAWHYRTGNGQRLILRRHECDGDGSVSLRVGGVSTRLGPLALRRQRIGGRDILAPQDIPAYLARAIDTTSPIGEVLDGPIGPDRRIIDETEFRVWLYLALGEAAQHRDLPRRDGAASLLRELGHPQLWFKLAGMEGRYMAPSARHMSDLIANVQHLIHIGDGHDGAFYVDLWYPYCKAANPNTILAVRSRELFRHLRQTRRDLDVILLRTQMDAEWLFANAPKLRAVLFVSNVGNNLAVLKFNHLTHVWLGHGDSDKVASCHKFFRAYDEVWAAGRAQIDRFLGAGFDHQSVRFRIVGRPTLRDRLPQIEAARPNGFLYLPTWEGNLNEQGYSSVGQCQQFLAQVAALTGEEGRIKFHPWLGRRLARLARIEERFADPELPENRGLRIIPREQLAADQMTDARFMIADVSSVVSDFIVTGRPIFLYMPRTHSVRMATSAMPMERYCYIFHNPAQLLDLVRRVIVEGDDWLAPIRNEARHYFVDLHRTMNGAFEAAMANLVSEHPSTPHPWHVDAADTPVTALRDTPLVVGHRGAKDLFCENSLQGFREAARMPGLDAVEFDVHLAADGVPVVIHDATLDRTTLGSGAVCDRSASELAAIPLRWRPPGTREDVVLDEGVPTLDQVLDVFRDTGQQLYIEIKTDAQGNHYPGLEARVLAALRARGLTGRSVLSSFAPNILHRLRALDGDLRLEASANFRSVEMLGGMRATLREVATVRNCGLTLDGQLITALQTRNDCGIDLRRVGEYTVNTPEQLVRALNGRRRVIFTDNPRDVIGRLQARAGQRPADDAAVAAPEPRERELMSV